MSSPAPPAPGTQPEGGAAPPPPGGSEADAASAAESISVAEADEVPEEEEALPLEPPSGMHQPTVELDLTDAAISQDIHLAADGGERGGGAAAVGELARLLAGLAACGCAACSAVWLQS